MKILKQKIKYKLVDIEPIQLTLLSEKQYTKSEANIPPINTYWWLRSPGRNQRCAAYVLSDGSCNYDFVSDNTLAVRPALKFKGKKMKVEDTFILNGYSWTVIMDGVALCDGIFCQMAFRQDENTIDANDYTKSDIKAYLDKQFKRMKGETNGSIKAAN